MPGTAALACEYDQKCPDCPAQLRGCDVASISEHLCSCGGAGGWHHQARALNGCVQSMFTDIGIVAKLEPPGTSPGSLHRAADVGSARMPVPTSFDAGGTHAIAMDSGVCYFSRPKAPAMASKPGWGAAQVERKKPAAMAREVAQGKRAPLAAGTTFVAVGIDARGRTGPGFHKLCEWLAEHAVAHTNLLLPGMTAAQLRVRLITMWRTRLSVALHRALAESYVRRAEMLRAAVALQQGVMPLAVVDVLRGEEGVVGWG
jgi:hypothetical protein